MGLGSKLFLLVLPVLGRATLSNDKKIANGDDAKINQFPFMASYQYQNKHYCGCTIISEYWVLTAAHCIDTIIHIKYFDNKQLFIVAGITNLYIDNPQKQVRMVRKQFKHHNYDRKTLVNDIGLIVLCKSFNFGNGISNVRYSTKPNFSPDQAVIAGWGYLRSSYKEPSPKLQYAIGQRISNDECNGILHSLIFEPIKVTSEMTCIVGYYKKNETTCDGDSGGPLLQQLPSSENYQQFGIISWDVKPCGLVQKPSVSTLIYPYLRWIDCIMYYQNIKICKYI